MKNILITGASSGIGRETALQLAQTGQSNRLILVARRADLLEELKGLVETRGNSQAVVVALDLTSPEAVPRLCQELEARGISVDVLINNAGFGHLGRFTEMSWERQMEMLQLNVVVLTQLTGRVLPGMRQRGQGHILNVGSLAGFLPGPFQALYYASKAFVNSFSQALEEELRGTGVSVTTICPGPTSSEFQRAAGINSTNEPAAMSSQQVASLIVESLQTPGGLRIPGLSNQLAAHIMGIIPPGLRARVGGWLGRKRIANP